MGTDEKSEKGKLPYLVWEKKVAINQAGSHDLELIGAFYNAYRKIYLLSFSKALSALFIAFYDIETSTVSKFKRLCKVDEVMYTASVFDETESHTDWYILGKQDLWTLRVSKPNFDSGELSTVTKFPLGANHHQKVFDGASLIVFDKIAWIVGGSICKDRNKNPLDTRSRVIVSEKWAEHLNGKKGGYYGGHVSWSDLVHPRTAPILHMHGKEIICIGGNQDSKTCIFETLAARPYYWPGKHGNCREDSYMYLYTTERSILAHENLNCSIKTLEPRPASCFFKNHIFIFSRQLFSESRIYYKFHYLGGRGTGSGNGDWEFLIPGSAFKPDSLRFTSAKATAIGSNIYLILFNAGDGDGGSFLGEGESSGKTKITVFEISES